MSVNAAVVERPESRPAARNDSTWLSVLGDFPSLLGDLPASWFESSRITDGRSEARCWCDSRARLTPLDEPAQCAGGPPIQIALTDISRHGIGFSHAEPLPYRLVQITFEPEDKSAPTLVVRLQWCRFRKPGFYESGGQIQRVVTTAPAAASTLRATASQNGQAEPGDRPA
jgi:hypothetical protein